MKHLWKAYTLGAVLGVQGIIHSGTAIAKPMAIKPEQLDAKCRAAIYNNRSDILDPKYPVIGPELHRDIYGDISIGWRRSTGEFFQDALGEIKAAKAIGSSCPKVANVTFVGPTGGTMRWYIRHNNFTVRHSRGSGYPGDDDTYWGGNDIPFNYDPSRKYK